jgi:hypothetical protein
MTRGIGFHLKMPSTTSLYVMSKRVVKKNNDEEWLVQCANTSLQPHLLTPCGCDGHSNYSDILATSWVYTYILWVVCDLGLVVLVSNSLEYWNSLNSCQLLGSWTPLQVVGREVMWVKVLNEFYSKVARSCCDKKKGSVVLFFALTPLDLVFTVNTQHTCTIILHCKATLSCIISNPSFKCFN